ncbi:hypothetical protein Nepgr_007340 [Nepenthes gracilis]|uniref:Uncharacterized protein n=1 Tax=Nepenthes gracilis TaxID=150966 RepID=A0AAD3S6S9_NEPGR|nr:hypothetical protein Nepgr_007340 [Nepenthes gracilis]
MSRFIFSGCYGWRRCPFPRCPENHTLRRMGAGGGEEFSLKGFATVAIQLMHNSLCISGVTEVKRGEQKARGAGQIMHKRGKYILN